MKQKIIILLTIYLLFNSALSAQNIEKMNKSELREHIVYLTTKIDSLKNENINLQESISNLSTNSSLLEQKNKTNEVEISRINELILKNENERKRIISENKIGISKLNEIIITLKDSISSVQDEKEPKTEEEVISDIREKFGAINYNLNSYKKIKKDLMEELTEGGELEGYFKKEELKKIVTSYYGEMGKLIEEYYFWDNELFFVFTQDYSYNMPMYMVGSKVDKIDENRYYIHNNKLIRWLNPNKEKVAKSKFTTKESEILQNTKKLEEQVK